MLHPISRIHNNVLKVNKYYISLTLKKPIRPDNTDSDETAK